MRPCIGVSACLLGNPVRYDGTDKRHDAVLQLGEHFELIPLCPETAIGLGVPRPPIRLQQSGSGIIARGVDNPALDPSAALRDYAHQVLQQYPQCIAFVLKARSPSCGVGTTPLHDPHGNMIGVTSGLFASVLAADMTPRLLVDEECIADAQQRAVFVAACLALVRQDR